MLINIVYPAIGDSQLPPTAVSGFSCCSVIWSRLELPDADVYFYVNSYSLRSKEKPKKVCILYISEPLCVWPVQYTRRVWRQFDFIFIWNDVLHHPRFISCLRPFAGFPMSVPWNEADPVCEQPNDLLKRRKAICMINNNKRSPIAGELYSMRRNLASWFHQDNRIPFDVYGQTPFAVPNYRGPADAGKLKTLRQYRFALCLENLYHPIWSNGYCTEKVFDALYALTVPIYLGCYDIEKYLPAACFIDYRKFTGPEQLRDYLEQMSDAQYLGYVESIQRFIHESQPLQRYHWGRLYERIARLMHEVEADPEMIARVKSQPLPRSYPMTERNPQALLRFYLYCLALRSPKLVALWKKAKAMIVRLRRVGSQPGAAQ